MAKVNLDTAARLDITCRKGDTFALVVDFGEAISATADNYTMKVAETDTSGTFEFESTASNFQPSGNQLAITIGASETATWNPGTYVYDLEEDDGTVVQTRLYGTFVINEDVS